VVGDNAHVLSQILGELADKLKHGEVSVTSHTDRPDKTAKIIHRTYVVGGGLDRVEVNLRVVDHGDKPA
jgi:hypothetical protein